MSQHGYPERLSNRSKPFQDDACGQPTMEVLVETLTGTAFEMTVSPSDTIFAIKSKIFRVEGIPVSQQHLLYNLKELEDTSRLRDHAIGDGATLRLVLSMRGGPVSTRRLPLPLPPSSDAHWRDIEDLLDNNSRDESLEWLPSGCKVTVLVFRDGEKVNMIRVIENEDGTYSPLSESKKYSSSLKSLVEDTSDDGLSGSVQENAVTMGKMLELRRRMENLSVQRGKTRTDQDEETGPENAEAMQKTRSEETLSVPSLLDEPSIEAYKPRNYPQYSKAEDSFPTLYDGNYTRYDYDCSFADKYTLLPPIRSRADSDQSIQEAITGEASTERIKLSDALAGSILVKTTRRDPREEEATAILEESVCLDGTTLEDCHLGPNSTQLATKNLAPIPTTTEYGPLVGCEASGWRVRGFGSSSQLAPPAPLSAAAHSASSLQLRAPPPRPHPPLSDALFSSSTSDLEKLKRNRLLPALSRHRNREHLHLSDEGLDLSHRTRNLEVGCERRQRRIKKIAELENSQQVRFKNPYITLSQNTGEANNEMNKCVVSSNNGSESNQSPSGSQPTEREEETQQENNKQETQKKIPRIRCGYCRKRLSIATVHKCRCGSDFCAPHRYAEVHGCAYDYKANAQQYLQRANPLVSAPKLPKI